MGVWSASVSGSDDFQDVKYQFFDYFYHDKISVEVIEKRIIEIYRKDISDEESGEWHDVYFALAWCEWKCGVLSAEILRTVESIIESGKNLEYWRELEAAPTILSKRKKELKKFLGKIKTEYSKPVKRRFVKPFVFPLKTGDVFACFSKVNGCYGCGVALEVRDSQLQPWEEEYHFRVLLAISDFTPKDLPTVEQVVNAKVRDVFWNGGCAYNLPKSGVRIISNIAERIDKDYTEYFGSQRIEGRIYSVSHLRPAFDDLISPNKDKRITDAFSISGKTMDFFFKKSNLPTTEEVLKSID